MAPVERRNAFVRLLTDYKDGNLARTFARMDISGGAQQSAEIEKALAHAQGAVTLPARIIRRVPNIFPHKQQQLH